MLEQIDKILTDILEQVSLGDENLSEYVKRLIDVMEYDTPYTLPSLMEMLELKSKKQLEDIIFIRHLSLILSK